MFFPIRGRVLSPLLHCRVGQFLELLAKSGNFTGPEVGAHAFQRMSMERHFVRIINELINLGNALGCVF